MEYSQAGEYLDEVGAIGRMSEFCMKFHLTECAYSISEKRVMQAK